MDKENKIVNVDGKEIVTKAFLIEESHPAIGRILIVNDIKYKILDDVASDSGTFIAKLTPEDESYMEEYDEALETLSEKLINKVDVKRLIKENIKEKTLQEIKTGLYILNEEEKGAEIEEEHHRGCYHFKMFHKNQCFEFAAGSEFNER